MKKSPQVHPMALAMEWVGKIITAVLMMVLPGLAGQWLDGKIGTGFLSLLGFGFGIALAIAYLLAISKAMNKSNSDPKD